MTDLSQDETLSRDAEIGVINIIAHPEFNETSFDNDIALMELAAPVDLPTVSLYSAPPADLIGSNAFIVGWGVADNSDPQRPKFPLEQRFAQVPLISNEICNGPQSYNGDVTDNMFCAGLPEGGIDSCQGDSGGPMIVGVDGLQVQIGIVSFGNGCALPNFYGVYTNISNYRAWVLDYVQASFLPGDGMANDPSTDPVPPTGPAAPPTETPPTDTPPTTDAEPPTTQTDPTGPNPFGTGGSSGGGGGAEFWWLLMGIGAVAGRLPMRLRQ